MLATDGSRHALRAAETAVGLARGLANVRVTILHVSADAPARSQLLQAELDIRSVLETEAHRAIVSTERLFEEAGVPYQLEVALGDPASRIVELARRDGVDLIVIGSRGRGTVGAMLLGSVSQKVAHDAHCPVMIVK